MPSTVTVNMRTCGKMHRITVSARDDGDYDVAFVTDCKDIRQYADRLKVISMTDATDAGSSRIFDPKVCESVSPSCLVPVGVMNAAWLEMGMMAKSLAHRAHDNDIVLDPEDQGGHEAIVPADDAKAERWTNPR